MRRLAFSLVAVAGLIAPCAAQSNNPAWLDQLSEQVAAEHECAVDLFINIREGELAGRKTYEARVQCRDGRQFDASRTEPETEFAISLCETTAVC